MNLNDKEGELSEVKIKFFKKITVRTTLLLLIILSTGIGITISYYLNSQNLTIIESRESAVKEESDILYHAIKNNMLAGEAPIAVELFRQFSRMDDIGEIKLYRANGISAFSDNSTLNQVNKNLKKNLFKPKVNFLASEKNETEEFKKAVKDVNDVFVKDIKGDNKRIIIYKTLINQPKCSVCHGVDHVVRGVIKITSPLNSVYKQTRKNLILSAVIYSIVVFILSVSIMFFLHRIVITRVFKISSRVHAVGLGDFKTKIEIDRNDEIGVLGEQINFMIEGLHERFKLSRFVSKSTIDHIRSSDDIELGGEIKLMTVLFTDIRGFTAYSEKREPGEVMSMLNRVMNAQTEIISMHRGDIDKFVGDEIMAVFTGEDMVVRAARAAIDIVRKMNEDFSEPGNEIQVGIGINTGEMIAGNMGAGNRMDRTVIGDAVNLGSRLCSIAGRNTIVISEDSYSYVKDRVEVHEHDSIKVKGKEKPVKIYTLRRVL